MHTMLKIELQLNAYHSFDFMTFPRKQSYCVEDFGKIIHYCYSYKRKNGFGLDHPVYLI